MNYNEAMADSNEINIYDETAQRIQAAFMAFRQLYEVQHPLPISGEYPAKPLLADRPNTEDKPKKSRFLGAKQIGMLLGLIGSIVVSASHDIPVFLNLKSGESIDWFSPTIVIVVSIVVMIEVALVTFAYSTIENTPSSESAKKVQWITSKGLYFIFTVAVLANTYYVLQESTAIESVLGDIWAWVRIVIFLLVGMTAPLVALMTGDILAIDVLRHNGNYRRDVQAWEEKTQNALEKWQIKADSDNLAWERKCEAIKADYEARKENWLMGLHQSWNAQKAKWGAGVNIQVSKPEPKMLENTVSDSLGQSDRSKTLNMKGALQYIELHQLELETVLQTILDTNPNATQSERAMALAEAISGDSRGYKTVIRAYKSLGKDV